MTMLYGALERLDTEADNEALKGWVRSTCDPEFGLISGFVGYFIDSVEDTSAEGKALTRKLLKILK